MFRDRYLTQEERTQFQKELSKHSVRNFGTGISNYKKQVALLYGNQPMNTK